MSKFQGRKRIFASSTIALLIMGGGMAYAYFSTTGSGSGNAGVGTNSPFVITQIADGSTTGDSSYLPVALLPGGPSEVLAISIYNPSTGDQGIHGVTVSPAMATFSAVDTYNALHVAPDVQATTSDVTSGGIPVAGCLASWFDVTNWSPVSGDIVVAGHGYAVIGNNLNGSPEASSTLSVSLMSEGVIQDACKDAAVDLNFASN